MALNFQIQMQDGVSGPAQKAASNLYRLDAAIKNEGASLQLLRNQMAALSASGDKTSERFQKLSAAASDQRTKIGALKDQLRDQGGLPKAAGAAGGLEGALKKLEAALQPLAGESGALGKALAAIGPEGLIAAAGIGAIVIAATAAGAAIGYMGSKLLELGIQASEAKGDVTRSLELLYGSEKAALHTYRVLESLTGQIAISQDRVMELADTLIKAGQVNGNAMVRSIETIGKAEAARAGAGKVLEGVITRATSSRMFSVSRSELMQVGLSYKQLAAEVAKGVGMTTGEAELRLRTGGVRVKEGLEALGRVVDAKMGDLAMKKFQTVGYQTQRLKDGFMRLFEGVNGAPFARLLMQIANALSDSTVTGAALRDIIKRIFDSMSDAAEAALPYMSTLFEGSILLAYKLYNATYPIEVSLRKMFKNVDTGSFEDKMLLAIDTVGRLATGMGKVLGYTPLWKTLGVVIGLLNLPLIITTAAFFGLGYGIGFALDKGKDLLKAWGNMPTEAFNLAGDIISGFVNGITSGAGRAADALKDMATNALKKFKHVFDSHSPSRVMRLEGLNIDAGLAEGVNDNAHVPVDAVGDMSRNAVDAAKGGASGAALPVAKVGASAAPIQLTLHIHERAIVVSGSNANEIAASLKDPLTELLADVLEKAAVMTGALEIKGAA
jgi:hypothetical protein